MRLIAELQALTPPEFTYKPAKHGDFTLALLGMG
jgi:hypothetical protein